MNSQTLVKKFFKRLETKLKSSNPPSYIGPNDPVIDLYGTDEFQLNRKDGKVVLSGTGSVSCPGIKDFKGSPEWVGVVESESGWEIILGYGDPYAQDIPAVPHALGSQFKESKDEAKDSNNSS